MAINPLQPPINYAVDVQSPFTAAFEGMKFTAGRETLEAARNQRELEAQARQAALAQQQQFQSRIDSFFSKPPTERKYAELEPLLIGANKQQFDALKQIGENMNADQLANAKKFTGQVLLSFEANPENAKTMLRERLAAEPDPNQKRAFEDILAIADTDPAEAARLVEENAAASFGKTWYEGIEAARKGRREAGLAPAALREANAKADLALQQAENAIATAVDDVAKAAAQRQLADAQAEKAKIEAQFTERKELAGLNLNAAQVRNINSEISNRAAKLNLDTQTMQATVAEKLSSIQKNLTELPADTRKLINESAVAAAASKQSAAQYLDLAKRLEASGGGFGAATSFADYLRKQTGNQSPLTSLRQEYTRIRNSAAIKALPPGVATDKDIELALKGIPPENADAVTIASFLRGLGKMQDIESSVANAKTDWLATNNGVLARAKNVFQAGDYATKQGESFNDFTQRVVQDVSKRYDTTQQTSLVQQIPTDANPRPAAAQSNIRSQADAILRGTP